MTKVHQTTLLLQECYPYIVRKKNACESHLTVFLAK